MEKRTTARYPKIPRFAGTFARSLANCKRIAASRSAEIRPKKEELLGGNR